MPQAQTQTRNGERAVSSTSQTSDPERHSPYTITEEILEKRLKHENKGRYITQLCAAIAASLAAFSFGTILGWSSPSNRHLMKEENIYNLTQENYAWVASLMPLGCSAGIIPWSYAVSKIGPKHTLIIQSPLYILGLLTILTFKMYNAYLAGRFFSGFLSVANLIGGECLLMDTVHRGHLPHLIVFFHSSVWMGVLMSYIIGYFWSKYLLSIVCACVPALNTMLLIFLPESPVFLYDKSELKAENALSWYRGNKNISTEMRSIRKDAEIRKIGTESNRYMLYSKVVLKGLSIVLGLTFLQVFSGFYAFVFYTFLLWNEVNYSFADTITYGSVLYISNFIASMVHYRVPFGVRKPLLLSTTLTAISLLLLTTYLFLCEQKFVNFEEWIPLVLVCIFVVSYEIGLGTYVDILLFEYLPYQVHVLAKIITRIWFWIQVFFVTKFFITIRHVTNNYIPFFILTVVTFMGIIFCYFFVVETKGKNLIQIQIEIGGNPIGNRGSYRHHYETTTALTIT